VNGAAPALFERATRRRRLPSEVVAAAVLAAVWIVLWTLFAAGVVERGAALHAAGRSAAAAGDGAVAAARP
jgi:hypothetical protein